MSAATTNRSGVLKLWLLNLLGNAAVLGVWYYWLLIPDAHGWQVAWSAVLALLTMLFILWLRAGTLAWFRVCRVSHPASDRRRIPAGLRGTSFRWRSGLAVCVVDRVDHHQRGQLHTAILGLDSTEGECRAVAAQRDARVRLAAVSAAVGGVARDLGPDRNDHRRRGIFRARTCGVRCEYCASRFTGCCYCVLMALAAWVPYKLVTWVPELSTLRQQAWSAGLRFAAAYFLMITAGLG